MRPLQFSRRDMLRTLPGFGMVALAGICAEESARAAGYSNPLAPKSPHFTPRAKRVVMITMRGGPSHVDTFDSKPALAKHAGEAVASDNKSRKLLPSPFKFSPHGESGLMISEVYPHVAKHADDICLLNSMQTDVPNHPQAFLMAHTGEFRFPRPSLGAWTLYGLGTENKDLPGFVTISPPSRFGGSQNYGAGFLPAIYQGTSLGQSGQPVAGAEISNLRPAASASGEQRRQLDLVQELNREFLNRKTENLELEGAIESFELAFRMQGSLPDVMRLDRESAQTLEMYGIGSGAAGRNGKGGGPADFGRQCLMARRLLEAGVRFVEVCHEGWDQHNGLKEKITSNALATDQPIGALLTDLKQRGMLKDTLVVWGGEFGRTPGGQSDNGRDHNSRGFTMWAAGGGIKGGQRYGSTDEFGYEAIENKMHHHDLHATMLHLLGLDHEKLTYRFGGRDYKLTGVSHAQVAKGIIA